MNIIFSMFLFLNGKLTANRMNLTPTLSYFIKIVAISCVLFSRTVTVIEERGKN